MNSPISNSPHSISESVVTLNLGKFRVTALKDGEFELPAEYLVTSEGSPLSKSPVHIDLNAFVIQGEGRTILVDTGGGSKLSPATNHLPGALGKARLKPEDVDTVLCTHIHPDHTNGLVSADGSAMFKNATIYVHQKELEFWLDDTNRASAPEELRYQFLWAREAFAPYADKIKTFDGEEKVLGEIGVVELFGHTPGHCGFVIDGGNSDRLLIWGDCVHAILQQTADPTISFVADMDPQAATSSRIKAFEMAAEEGLLVTGMHVDFPGFGRIQREGPRYSYALA